jgi:hypothetical protein
MMGAFGPVSCWTSQSATGTASEAGGRTEPVTTAITRQCESGVDYLLGSTGGNAPVLFAWSMVLLVLVALGGFGAWTGRRYVTWLAAVASAVITVIGVFSIGWYFLFPTLFLLVAAVALSVLARRETDGTRPTAP